MTWAMQDLTLNRPPAVALAPRLRTRLRRVPGQGDRRWLTRRAGSTSSPSAAGSTPTSPSSPRAGGRGRAHRRRRVQHLRGDRRGGAPGAPGDPQGAARAAGRAADRHRLRGADRPGRLRRHARGRPGAGQRREGRAGRLLRDADAAACGSTTSCSVRETAGHLVDGLKERARAYVEVQNGCDHRCTFCIIPFGRGNSRSVAAGAGGRRRCARLAAPGYAEVVLTGVDLTSWGADLPGAPTLGQLVGAHPGRWSRSCRACGSRRSTPPRSTPDLMALPRRASRGCARTCTCRCSPATT